METAERRLTLTPEQHQLLLDRGLRYAGTFWWRLNWWRANGYYDGRAYLPFYEIPSDPGCYLIVDEGEQGLEYEVQLFLPRSYSSAYKFHWVSEYFKRSDDFHVAREVRVKGRLTAKDLQKEYYWGKLAQRVAVDLRLHQVHVADNTQHRADPIASWHKYPWPKDLHFLFSGEYPILSAKSFTYLLELRGSQAYVRNHSGNWGEPTDGQARTMGLQLDYEAIETQLRRVLFALKAFKMDKLDRSLLVLGARGKSVYVAVIIPKIPKGEDGAELLRSMLAGVVVDTEYYVSPPKEPSKQWWVELERDNARRYHESVTKGEDLP